MSISLIVDFYLSLFRKRNQRRQKVRGFTIPISQNSPEVTQKVTQ